LPELAVVAAITLALLGFIFWQQLAFRRERDIERAFRGEREAAFAAERQEWVRERRDLNNRIQVPEAAPFMEDSGDDQGGDDLPVLPGGMIDEEELEQARAALNEVGYDEGPVA
jgi:hypothetical protein